MSSYAKICVLKACPNRNLKSTKNTSIKRHGFPQNLAIRSEWENFVKKCNKTSSFKAYKGALLCSAHFTPESYRVPNGALLRKDAVPTIAPVFTQETAFKLGFAASLVFCDGQLVTTASTTGLDARHANVGSKDDSLGMENISNSAASANFSKATAEKGSEGCTLDTDKDMTTTDKPEFIGVDNVDMESTASQSLQNLSDERRNADGSVTIVQEKESDSALTSPDQYAHVENTVTPLRTIENNSDNHMELDECIHTIEQTASEESDNDLSGIALMMDSPQIRDHGSNNTSACSVGSSISDLTPPSDVIRRKRRKAYPGDLSPGDFSTPRRREKNLKLLKDSIEHTRHKLENSLQRTRRAQKKVENLVSLLKDLQKQRMVTAEAAKMIEVHILRCFHPLRNNVKPLARHFCLCSVTSCC